MIQNDTPIQFIITMTPAQAGALMPHIKAAGIDFNPRDSVTVGIVEHEGPPALLQGSDLRQIIAKINRDLAQDDVNPRLNVNCDIITMSQTRDLLMLAYMEYEWDERGECKRNWDTQEDWARAVSERLHGHPDLTDNQPNSE